MASLLRWLQLTSVITNLLIALLGLIVVAVGATTLINEKKYFTITDNRSELYRLPYSLIMVGICVITMAVVGIVGALTTKMLGGRILLGVYTFVLSLVIFSEIAAGGSALRARTTFEKTFINSSLESLKTSYLNKTQMWDKFQTQHKCCGAENYTSYTKYHYVVPKSCCKDPNSLECEDAQQNPTNDTFSQNFYSDGCPKAVLQYLQRDYIVIAVVMMVFGVSQFVGVLMGCFLAAVSSREEREYISPHYNPLSTVQT